MGWTLGGVWPIVIERIGLHLIHPGAPAMTFAVFATIAAPFSVGFLALLGGFAYTHFRDVRGY